MISSYAYSQKILKGVITDAITHEPLPNVIIGSANSTDLNTFKSFTKTDLKGKFNIQLSEQTDSLSKN